MREALIVGAGAALGAVARVGLMAFFAQAWWPLLAINVAGSALMGYYRPGPFWSTGMLGGFTSFATFALLSSELSPGAAAAYAAATLLGCVGAYLAGAHFGGERS